MLDEGSTVATSATPEQGEVHMREVDWDRAIVASLALSKAAGWSHDHAWRVAVKTYPAPRDRCRGGEVQLMLVDDGVDLDYEEIGHAEFMREATRQAYEGERPGLKHFTMDLVGDRDTTAFATRANAWRAA